MYLKRAIVVLAACASLVAATPYAVATDCINTGLVSKLRVDKKEKKSFAGDIKSLQVNYDYENDKIYGTIVWNTLPTSKVTTKIIMGSNDADGECSTGWDGYMIRGWSTKVSQDDWSVPNDKSWSGKFKITKSGKTSMAFEWLQPLIDTGNHMTITCVRIEVEGAATFYKSSTTCSGDSHFISCDGPGWVEGTQQLDLITNYAFSPTQVLDSMLCGVYFPHTPSSA